MTCPINADKSPRTELSHQICLTIVISCIFILLHFYSEDQSEFKCFKILIVWYLMTLYSFENFINVVSIFVVLSLNVVMQMVLNVNKSLIVLSLYWTLLFLQTVMTLSLLGQHFPLVVTQSNDRIIVSDVYNTVVILHSTYWKCFFNQAEQI